MAIRSILSIPDPVLRQVSQPVARVDDAVRALLDDMLDTMYEAPGIGLAAVQIGVPRRVVTIDVGDREAEAAAAEADGEAAPDTSTREGRKAARGRRIPKPLFLINPVILKVSEERSSCEEGCLSIPEYYAQVERPSRVTVGYVDREGHDQVIEADGLLATCLQHEIDHLDGRLFIDHISRLKREMVLRKFTKIARQTPEKPGSRKTG